MQKLARSLGFAVLLMLLLFLSLNLMPNLSEMGWKLIPPEPLIKGPEDCAKLNGSEQYHCFTRFAVERNDAELCSGIGSSFYRDKCYAQIIPRESGLSLCEKLSFVDKRSGCFSDFALSQGDPGICSKASLSPGTPDESSDKCFYAYALKNESLETCGSISDPQRMGGCLYFFARGMGDISKCSSDSDEATGICISSVAEQNQDPVLCTKAGEKFADNCLIGVAVSKQDSSLCERISNQSLVEMCREVSGNTH